jgi:hypothetical protein
LKKREFEFEGDDHRDSWHGKPTLLMLLWAVHS